MEADKRTGAILVVGGGVTGLLACCMLAKEGYEVHIWGVDTVSLPPSRTVALLEKSVQWLVSLGIWESVSVRAQTLENMAIRDGGIIKGGVSFSLEETRKSRWAEHLQLQDMKAAILEILQEEGVTIHRERVCRVGEDNFGVWVVDEKQKRTDGTLVLGADGRSSIVRKQAGIALRKAGTSLYVMTGLLSYCSSHIAEQYCGKTIERYSSRGLQTVISMVNDRAALLWLGSRATMERLDKFSEQEILHLLHQEMGVDGGVYENLVREKIFKLESFYAQRLSQKRTILLGEASHGFPPIAAQGLNLTIRGLQTLQNLLQEGAALGDLGYRYHQRHYGEVWRTCGKVAVLTELVLLPSGGMQSLVRGAAIHLLGHSRTFRELAVDLFDR